MQDDQTRNNTNAEYPRHGGAEGEHVNASRNNNEGNYSGQRGGRGGRGRGGNSWGNRNNARTSNNWRDEEQPQDDQHQGGGYRRGGYRGRGGHNNYRRNEEGGEFDEARDGENREEGGYRPFRGGRGGGFRGGRGGRGGYRQDRDNYGGNDNNNNNAGAADNEEEARTESRNENAWRRNTSTEEAPQRHDDPESGSWNEERGGGGRNYRDSYRGGRGGRGGGGGGRGGYGFRDRNEEEPPRRFRDAPPQAESPPASEESPVTQALPEGYKRRVQRPAHLRQNCRDEREVLELFESHHKQKGISLSNYDNIPIDLTPTDVKSVEDFTELDVEHQLAANIERCGYKKPTPVQRFGIPVTLAGNDLMACAQTGSGKTAAFLIPVIQYILVNGVSPAQNRVCRPIALVMAPTRELALQIYDEVRKLTFRTDIFYDVVYGGTPYPHRFENDILVACPGRLKDIFDRNILSFQAIKFLILDEADRMLEMGFEEQIEYLVASRYSDMPTAEDRQTLMFSATYPKRILDLAKRYLRKRYYLLTVGRVGSTTKNITQIAEKVSDAEKMDRLFEIIYTHKKTDLVLVFVETKKAADELFRELRKEGIPSSTIHGDRRQEDRERALADFKGGVTPILVATDVASRGLDIPDVSHVIQYDLPNEMDDYVHRIGRTGRAGNKGTATFFYTRKNAKLCLDMAKYLREHEQNVPGWLKEEAEHMEGSAMMQDMGRRPRGGGGGGGHREPQRESNETWGDGGGSRGGRRGGGGGGGGGGGARGGGGGARGGFVDDGGF